MLKRLGKALSHSLWRYVQLPFAVRVFALYFIFVGLSGYFMLTLVVDEIKPVVRQSSEENLFDTAQFMAALVAADFKPKASPALPLPLQRQLSTFGMHELNASIWGVPKSANPHRIYITDQQGMVVFDSKGQALGHDYSRWNDVYLTLRGQYGARSSKADPNDEQSSVMHVAAPIIQNQQIVGVLTIAKPNRLSEPFITRSQQYLTTRGIALMAFGLLIGALLAWRLQRGLNRLNLYAEQLSQGERIGPPKFRVFFEFATLAAALDRMRQKLAGRAYAEQYVQTLTHELKSPLTAIQAAAELLQSPLEAADQQRFSANILQQSQRVHHLIERLLQLSALEQQSYLTSTAKIDLSQVCQAVIDSRSGRINQQQCLFRQQLVPITIQGDAMLLEQALGHLFDNALDFAPREAELKLTLTQQPELIVLQLTNQGPHIPDYALERLTERFYSLPRPGKQQKSTGLGLNFVAEVSKLHQAEFQIINTELAGKSAVQATLIFHS